MVVLNFVRQHIRFSGSLRWTLLISNAVVLLINLFVGLLVYQNPLIVLSDSENMLSVLGFGAGLSAGICLVAMAISWVERLPGTKSPAGRTGRAYN